MLLTVLLLPSLASAQPLSHYIHDDAPWLTQEANSEQRQPVYLGLTPLQIVLKEPGARFPSLPESLRKPGEEQLQRIRQTLERSSLEVEFWPARDDEGRLAFTFARWREDPSKAWRWLTGLPEMAPSSREENDLAPRTAAPEPQAFFPKPYRTWVKEERDAVFNDFLLMPGLYDKPVFGDCVWTDESGEDIIEGWLPTDRREQPFEEKRLCMALPQPAFFNGFPTTFVVKTGSAAVVWPEELRWASEEAPPPPEPLKGRLGPWSKRDLAQYRKDVRLLSGDRFTRKNSAQPDHQLVALADYLQERYAALGLPVRRADFRWKGTLQPGLIALIPGSAKEEPPVLLVDHIDTAFCEDVFDKKKLRVSSPGADDNAVATAALLQAGRMLKDVRPKRDIWLVHLTGEEFPADDLGARRLVRELLAGRQKLRGVVVLDMIGYRDPRDPVFQVNAGPDAESLDIARKALGLEVAAPFSGRLRTRYDPESYLYNTDALIFSEAGYPVILINEHINAKHNLTRRHYHESTDTSSRLDFAFAQALSRLAIETVALLASPRADALPNIRAGPEPSGL
ncbi:MAG: M28 family peptidase [Elusimicrobiota bacterium]